MLNGRSISTEIYNCFETEHQICLLLEYLPGGDLFKQLELSQEGYLTEAAATFYAAATLLLLE